MSNRFTVNYINILTSWEHNLPANKDCSICRCNLNSNSLYHQDKGLDSYVVQGTCNHAYHSECIKQWIESNSTKHCPICCKPWVYKNTQ
jgi:hypothetical protein